MAVVLFLSTSVSAQIEYGGEPYNWEEKDANRFAIPTYSTGPLDMDAIRAADAVTDPIKEAPYRFGYEWEVSLDTDHYGVWTELDNGDKVWQLAIECPEATSISFIFSRFKLVNGAKLFIWNQNRTAFKGAYTHESNKPYGSFGVGLSYDDKVIVELIEPADAEYVSQLEIGTIVHGYRSILKPAEEAWEAANRGPFGNSGACNVNVNCPEGDMWQVEKRSVALIVSGGFAACSGALVNNTAQDGTPYFLTANHCLGGNNNWVFYFNHESANCLGSNGPTSDSVSGSVLRASNGGSDFALLELNETPPADFNVQYCGWDNSDAQTVANTTGIHHPSGDVKKICFDEQAPSQTTQFGAAVWFIDDWDVGVTEGGSSGSPLFDQNHRIIGQLYGGGAACSGNTDNGQPDWYGRFGVSWDGSSASSRLRDWLDPLNTGATILDGYPEGFEALAYDVLVGGFEGLDDVICGNSVTPSVIISNMGSTTINEMDIEVELNGTVISTIPWTGTLAQFESETVGLPTLNLQDGNNTLTVTLISPNDENDQNNNNNSASASFTANTGPTLDYTLELLLDDYGSETTWELRNDNNQVVYEGGPYGDDLDGTLEVIALCIPEGCYTFTIFDEWGDGICCAYGEGSYTLLNDLGQAFASGGEFQDEESQQFCTQDLSVASETSLVQAIFPNPAKDQVNITLKQPSSVRMFDATGRIVLSSGQLAAGTTLLDIAQLPAGMYVMAIDSEGKTESHRIVIE